MSTTAGTIVFWIWVTPFLLLILLMSSMGIYVFTGWFREWFRDPDRFGRTKRYFRRFRNVRRPDKGDLFGFIGLAWLLGGMLLVGFLER